MMNYEDVLEHIMKRFYRVYGEASPIRLRLKRNDLAALFNELGYTVGAEIGVHRGEYSEILCENNPELFLYSIDPWEVYAGGENESFSKDQKALDKFYEETKNRLHAYNCKVIRKTSMEAVKEFELNSLDFVYIDGNHQHDSVAEDLREWSKIVRRGGIVSGHDYGHYKHRNRNLGSKRAIDNYIKEHNIRSLFLVNKNFQTSWFFINE